MPARREIPKQTAQIEATPVTAWALVAMLLASPRVRTIYLWGPPGVGKTYSAYHEGRLQDGVFAITLTEDTPAAELRGHYLPVGRDLVWHDGPFTAAMRQGARLVVNELTHGTPETHSLLHPVLESIETARLTLPTNETVRPAPGFHVICTDNLPPEDLPPSLQDRFDCVVELPVPHPEAIAALSRRLRRVAERASVLEQERSISLRRLHAVDRLIDELGLPLACTAVFGGKRGQQIHDAIVLAEAGG